MKATIHPHPTDPACVRLRWSGHYADFDPCPVRNLTAEESARDWAASVLGCSDPEVIQPLLTGADHVDAGHYTVTDETGPSPEEVQRLADALAGFTRSVGQSDPERDALAVRAGVVARRIRSRLTVYQQDYDLLAECERFDSPA